MPGTGSFSHLVEELSQGSYDVLEKASLRGDTNSLRIHICTSDIALRFLRPAIKESSLVSILYGFQFESSDSFHQF